MRVNKKLPIFPIFLVLLFAAIFILAMLTIATRKAVMLVLKPHLSEPQTRNLHTTLFHFISFSWITYPFIITCLYSRCLPFICILPYKDLRPFVCSRLYLELGYSKLSHGTACHRRLNITTRAIACQGLLGDQSDKFYVAG